MTYMPPPFSRLFLFARSAPVALSVALAVALAAMPSGAVAQSASVGAPQVEIDTGDANAASASPDAPSAAVEAPSQARSSATGTQNPYDSAASASSSDGSDAGSGGRSSAPVIAAPAASEVSNFLAEGSSMPRASIPPQAMPPVVVELFTSQGCSSCPPVDMMLSELADRPGVLALSYHIDYWDYLGWTDEFASPEFTQRQKSYARAAGERAIYTPQIIVGGDETEPSMGPVQLTTLIDSNRVGPALVSVAQHEDGAKRRFELQPQSDLGGKVGVMMVRYLPRRTVEIGAGENRGRQITYRNIVVSVEKLAEWTGRAPLRMTVSDGAATAAAGGFPDDTRHAILVQRIDAGGALAGPILTAIRLD